MPAAGTQALLSIRPSPFALVVSAWPPEKC
jgi:hypothetical protein